jgi:DNA-binding NarL/FixJ family response regulator
MRIAIADDHPIVLHGLQQVLDLEADVEVVAIAAGGAGAADMVCDTHPDVLVLDLRMPDKSGLDVLRELAASGSPTRVVVLTAAIEDQEALEAVRLGAGGIVLKDASTDTLLECLRCVHAGGRWLGADSADMLHRAVVRESDGEQAAARLTARELQIVKLVATGARNVEIARRLAIAEGTVKIHLHNVYEKLRLSGRVELVLFAREHGFV